MTQLVYAYVIQDLREAVVKVNLDIFDKNCFEIKIQVIVCFFLPDKSCPGGNPPCSGNGQCNHTTGLCTCNQGNQGTDCSGNT